MMKTGQFEQLQAAVLSASVSKNWQGAVLEWKMVGLEEDPSESGVCVCGQQNLRKLFTITNVKNDGVLFPIGSTCIGLFERSDLNEEISILEGMAKLRAAVLSDETVVLDKDFFSRAMLEHFYAEGVFTPDRYNDFDGEGDLEFLLSMFNKRLKENISAAQHRKIDVLLIRKVFPFLRDTNRIR